MSKITQQFRIAEIEVAKSLTDDKLAGVFRFENASRNRTSPTLLIIVDIQSSLYVYERLLDTLNSTAEQARHMGSQMEQDPLGRFEKLVQRLNEAVAKFTEQEASPLNWNRINIFIIELSENHLCFTGTGHLMNLFLQKQEDGSFRSFNLFGSLEQPTQADPTKPFASIICGDIKPGDLLMAGTTNLERLRSELRLKERLATLPPVTAALEIKQDLERRGIPDDFIAAIIASIAVKDPEPLPTTPIEPEQNKSTRSIEQLRQQEEETAKQLSPATPVKETLNVSAVLTQTGTFAKKITVKFFATLRHIKNSLIRHDPMALASLRGMNAGYGTVFTKRKKTIVMAAGAIVILGVAGILWLNHSKKVAAQTAAWNTTYDNASDQRNRAESDLVYGNEARARIEVNRAEKLIADLPTDTTDRKTKMSKLQKNLSSLNKRIRKVVPVNNVLELTTLSASANPGSLTAPILVKNTAYVVDESANQILKITLATKEIKRISLPQGTGPIVASAEGKNGIYFMTKSGKLISLSTATNLIKSIKWSHAKTSENLDTILYNNRLYSMDPADGQIWRSSQSGNGFGNESGYIKAANTQINDAVALAIDSNVYVLRSNGTVVQFYAGGQVSFGLYPISPPLRAASNIWTKTGSSLLYITDPADKRILEFDKDGTLKAQLTSPQFHDLRDLSVDEDTKRMIVTDGNRLLLVPLP